MSKTDNSNCLMEFRHESCIAEVFFDDKIASIQDINSKDEGKGHASTTISIIELFCKKKQLKEIWFPTVLNERLANHLSKIGYKYQGLGKHPKMNGEVFGFVKYLGGNNIRKSSK